MSTIKDVAITTPDGVKVKVGIKIYTVNQKIISSYKVDPKYYIKPKSGESRAYLIENEVIGVNPASTARTFTLRSDRGCEHTYSVKDNCIQDLYGKKANALKAVKEVDRQDSSNIKSKIVESLRAIKEKQDRIKKWKEVDRKLLAVHK